RAVGKVLARQGNRQIRARDELLITLGTTPKAIAPAERQRLEAAARACGYSPDSPEWKAFEARNREITITALTARGQVTVQDPAEGLDLTADSLDCAFNEQRQIIEATILGEPDAPAYVQTSDFHIRGPRVF